MGKEISCMVTGGSGFLGNNLVRYLMNKYPNIDVINYSRETYAVNLKSDAELTNNSHYHFVEGDLNNILLLNETLKKFKIGIIIHLAASTHVDRSFIYPEEFLQSNVIGTYNLLEIIRRSKKMPLLIYMGTDEVFGDVPSGYCKENDALSPRNPYSASKASCEMYCNAYHYSYKVPLIIARCHDEKTKIWTEYGLKNVREISSGDKVWSLNKRNELELSPVLEIIEKEYNGPMVHIQTQKVDMLITPNHRMLTKTRHAKIFKYIEAERLDQWKRCYLPASGEWKGEFLPKIDISPFLRKKVHKNTKKVETRLETGILMKFLGWYLSEGSASKSIEISNRDRKNKREIEEIIKELGFRPRIEKKRISFSSCLFQDFLGQFGKGAEDKTIPRWILDLDRNYLRLLFETLMKGDGHERKEYRRYYTKSIKLAQNVMEIGMKLGYGVSLGERETWNPSKTNKNKSFYVTIRRFNKYCIEKRNIKSESYSGKTWCLRTFNGNFFTLRKRGLVCSGNSMNMFGPYQHPEKLVAKIITRCLSDEHFTLYNGGSVRGWIFVKDTANALDTIIHNGKIGEVYHIPPDAYMGVPQVAEAILRLTKKQNLFDGYKGRRLKDDERYALDASKMTYELKWRPPTGFETGLKITIDWFNKNRWFWQTK